MTVYDKPLCYNGRQNMKSAKEDFITMPFFSLRSLRALPVEDAAARCPVAPEDGTGASDILKAFQGEDGIEGFRQDIQDLPGKQPPVLEA